MPANEIVPIEFTSSIAAFDDSTLVIGLFDGDPAACVAILKCKAEAGRALAEKIGRAVGPTSVA